MGWWNLRLWLWVIHLKLMLSARSLTRKEGSILCDCSWKLWQGPSECQVCNCISLNKSEGFKKGQLIEINSSLPCLSAVRVIMLTPFFGWLPPFPCTPTWRVNTGDIFDVGTGAIHSVSWEQNSTWRVRPKWNWLVQMMFCLSRHFLKI